MERRKTDKGLCKCIKSKWCLTIFVAVISTSPMWIENAIKIYNLRSKDFVKRQVQKDRRILDLLNSILKKYNADRVYVMRVHNGEYFTDGKHFQKISEIYETTNYSISHSMKDFQNIPLSLVNPILTDILKKGYYESDVKKIKEDSIKKLFEQQKIKSIYFFGLYKYDKLIGAVGVEFILSYNLFLESEIKEIKMLCELVQNIINE